MKQHYHLAATKVIFVDNTDQRVSELNLNVMLRLNHKNVAAKDVKTIQQQAQILFLKSIEDDAKNVTIGDVFVYGLSYLGHMTEKEFISGTQLENKPGADPKSASLLPGTGAFD